MEMFSIRLKKLREDAGYSQAQLAQILGVKQSTVGMWENGKNKPKNAKLEMLANKFNVSTDYLLGRSDQRNLAQPEKTAIAIPVLGKIPAGIPINAIEEIVDYEEIPAEWAEGGREYFSLQVKGNSMSPRYEDGDVLIMRKQDTCESGQDCAVMVNGNDATFKRVKISKDGIMLMPINPEYDPYVFTNKEIAELPVKILGVVVELRRKY